MALGILFKGQMLASGSGEHKVLIAVLEDGTRIPIHVGVTPQIVSIRDPQRFRTRLQVVYSELPVNAQAWYEQTAEHTHALFQQVLASKPVVQKKRRGGLLSEPPETRFRGKRFGRKRRTQRSFEHYDRHPVPIVPASEAPKEFSPLTGNERIDLRHHSTYNERPALEVGKELVLLFDKTYVGKEFTLGTIKSFRVRP